MQSIAAKQGSVSVPGCPVTFPYGRQQWLCLARFVASVLSPVRNPLPMRYMNGDPSLYNPPWHRGTASIFLSSHIPQRCEMPPSFFFRPVRSGI